MLCTPNSGEHYLIFLSLFTKSHLIFIMKQTDLSKAFENNWRKSRHTNRYINNNSIRKAAHNLNVHSTVLICSLKLIRFQYQNPSTFLGGFVREIHFSTSTWHDDERYSESSLFDIRNAQLRGEMVWLRDNEFCVDSRRLISLYMCGRGFIAKDDLLRTLCKELYTLFRE